MNSEKLIYKITKDYFPDTTEKEIKEIFHENPYKNPKLKFIFENHQEEFKQKFIEKTTKEHFFDFSEKLIEDLHKRYKLFIVSGTQTDNLEYYLKLIDSVEKFIEILGADEILSKVERFKIIFNKHQLDSKECLFVTDTLGDIKEANEVELKTIGVTWGIHDFTLLEQGKPYKIVHDVNELEEEIKLLD